MGLNIDLKSVSPDRRHAFNDKLPEEIREQGGTVGQALNDKVCGREDLDTGKEVATLDLTNTRAPAYKSLAEYLFFNTEKPQVSLIK